jgi:Ran GTPase-activating protein 1
MENLAHKTFHLHGAREMLNKERTAEILKDLSEETAKEIRAIKLSGKSFGLEAAEVASALLRNLKDLVTVDISDIIAGRPEEEALKSLEILTSALKGTSLKVINVSDNALGRKGIHAIRGLLESQSALEELYITNNGLDTAAAQLVAELLLFRKPTSLKVLHCINNLLRDGGGEALATVFAESPSLESVILTATRIGSEGGLAIARSLVATKSLRVLDLSDNNFDEEGSKLMAKALSEQPHLQSLNLSSTGLGDEGVGRILKALEKTAERLEVLNLAGNEITGEAASKIVKALQNKKLLRQLKLEENELGSEGVREIAEALKGGFEHLEELDFSMNEVDDDAAQELVEVVRGKKNFKVLRLLENEISEDMQSEMRDTLKELGKSHVLRISDEDEEEKKGEKKEESLDDVAKQLEKVEIKN